MLLPPGSRDGLAQHCSARCCFQRGTSSPAGWPCTRTRPFSSIARSLAREVLAGGAGWRGAAGEQEGPGGPGLTSVKRARPSAAGGYQRAEAGSAGSGDPEGPAPASHFRQLQVREPGRLAGAGFSSGSRAALGQPLLSCEKRISPRQHRPLASYHGGWGATQCHCRGRGAHGGYSPGRARVGASTGPMTTPALPANPKQGADRLFWKRGGRWPPPCPQERLYDAVAGARGAGVPGLSIRPALSPGKARMVSSVLELVRPAQCHPGRL